jgi:hypothetical protein
MMSNEDSGAVIRGLRDPANRRRSRDFELFELSLEIMSMSKGSSLLLTLIEHVCNRQSE